MDKQGQQRKTSVVLISFMLILVVLLLYKYRGDAPVRFSTVFSLLPPLPQLLPSDSYSAKCAKYNLPETLRQTGENGSCDRLPTVFCNDTSCEQVYDTVRPYVLCEIQSKVHSLRLLDSDSPCQLKQVVLTCDMLSQSSLPCTRSFVYHEVDYHSQFHCLNQIAQSVGAGSSSESKVPPLHHQVWFFEHPRELEFYEYIGLISHMRFFKPKAVFIWNYGNLPKNKWWQEFISQLNQPAEQTELLVNESYPNASNWSTPRKVFFFHTQLYSVLRMPPSHIYGKPIGLIQHKSDVARLEAVLLFGGFYADVDTISLRSHAPLLNYSVTMGLEDSKKLTNMAIFGEPHAPHLYNWHFGYTTFDKRLWGEFSLERNLRMARRCPHNVNIENTSMVTPTWTKRKQFYTVDMNISSSYTVHLFWRYILHTNLTDPSELQAPGYLVHRIFRGIYYGFCEICG